MSRMALVLAATIAVVALSSACVDEEILLATVPPGRPDGPPQEAQRCIDSSECPTRAFCARVDCSEIGGTCDVRPVFCEEEPGPVCGCDGITYWNDCLRRAAGVTAMAPGECTRSAIPCGGPGDPGGPRPGPGPGPGPGDPPEPTLGCPPGAICARLLPSPKPPVPPDPNEPPPPMESCPPDFPGTCWALPAVCPKGGGLDRWLACGPDTGVCRTTCDAIRSGQAHVRAFACE